MQKANGVIRFHSISDFLKSSGNRCFFWALAPCLLVVLLYCFVYEFPSPFPDSRDYLDLSTSLVERGRFIHSFEQGSGEYSITRTPGYPALIAIFQLFAGRHGFFILNLLFLYGTCVLTFKLANKLGIHAHKTLIALFVLSPGLITCSTVPLTEVPFCFWLMATLYLLTCDRFITAGLCLSMATFIRPAGILLFIIIALWILLKKKKMVYALLFAAAANVFPVGWSLRNYSHFGHYTYTTLSGHYLLHYKAGSYLSWRDDIPFDLMRKQLDAQLESSHPIERDKEAGQLGRKILLDNFMGFCLWTPRNLIYFMMPDITPVFERLQMVSGNRGTLDILRRKGLFPAIRHYFSGNATAAVITVLYSILFLGCTLLIAPGIWYMIKKEQYHELILLAGVCAYLWIIPVGNLDWRFRMPAAPLLFIFVCSGIVYLNGKHIEKQPQKEKVQ